MVKTPSLSTVHRAFRWPQISLQFIEEKMCCTNKEKWLTIGNEVWQTFFDKLFLFHICQCFIKLISRWHTYLSEVSSDFCCIVRVSQAKIWISERSYKQFSYVIPWVKHSRGEVDGHLHCLSSFIGPYGFRKQMHRCSTLIKSVTDDPYHLVDITFVSSSLGNKPPTSYTYASLCIGLSTEHLLPVRSPILLS